MSIPDSMIFVDIRISTLPSEKSFIDLSSSLIFIWPWATLIDISGTILTILSYKLSISLTLGHTTNIWPPLFFSLKRASIKTTLSHSITKVLIANLFTGGVEIRLKVLIPDKDNWRVLGIGVAVRVRTWMLPCNSFIFSFWATPKCCSSSIIKSPKLLKSISFERRAWVPITILTSPETSWFLIFFLSEALVILDNVETFIEVFLNRSKKLL